MLLLDTKQMLLEWNLAVDVAENLARMQAETVFAKASRSRVNDTAISALVQKRCQSGGMTW